MNNIKYTSKRVKDMELNAIEYVGPALLSLSVLLSGHSACTGLHAPHTPHAERGRMRFPKRVAARAPIPCPTPHASHIERVAAHTLVRYPT
jgi:hypothetical protein